MAEGIYIVAGEVSGDIHGAELLEALREQGAEVRVRGLGGPRMAEVAGGEIEDWLDFSAVMGIVEVLKHYKGFKKYMLDTVAAIAADPPAILLLIDYPGFNLRLAERVKQVSPETHVVQYVCPQVWAWKKGRIPKIARVVDTLVCLFPFETKLFPQDQVRAISLGHPVIDELTSELSEKPQRDKGLVGLFPGSREPEIARIFPTMLETALRLSHGDESMRFQVPAATPKLREQIQGLIAKKEGADIIKIEVTDGGSHALMKTAQCGIVTSGTATLEAAFFGLPHCIVYKLAWPTYAVAKVVVKIDHIGIINVLAGRSVVKEYVQGEAEPGQLMAEVERLCDGEEAEELQKDMAEVVAQLGEPGVHKRLATELIDILGGEAKA